MCSTRHLFGTSWSALRSRELSGRVGRTAVRRYDIRVQDPDSFILELLDTTRTRVLDALRKQRAALVAPPLSAQQLLNALERAGLVRTVQRLRPFTAEL